MADLVQGSDGRPSRDRVLRTTAPATPHPGFFPQANTGRSWPVLPTLLAVAAMLPMGANIRPGGLVLTTPRLLLLAAAPLVVMRLARKLSTPGFRIAVCDVVVVLAAIWMFLAVSMTQGVDRAAVGASVMILELCGGYFLVRSSLDRPGQAVQMARILACVIALDGVLSILDVVYERPVLHDIVGSVTGFDQEWQQDFRNGRMRAMGMQEHPIAFGTICAMGALLSMVVTRGVQRIALVAGCVTGLLTSNSSAPYGGFALGCLFLIYHRVMARFPWRWQFLMVGGGLIVGALFVFHPTPFAFVIEHASSNKQDGYYRLFIWSLVGPLVQASPWFGLGLESDWAARFSVLNTIDSFWLCSAANFGIPGAVSFALILITACLRPVRQVGAMTPLDTALGRVLGIIVFLYLYIGVTVHFWGTHWILIGVFTAMRVHLGEISVLPRSAASSRRVSRLGTAAA